MHGVEGLLEPLSNSRGSFAKICTKKQSTLLVLNESAYSKDSDTLGIQLVKNFLRSLSLKSVDETYLKNIKIMGVGGSFHISEL